MSIPRQRTSEPSGRIDGVENGFVSGGAAGCDYLDLFANKIAVARIAFDGQDKEPGARRFRYDLTGIAPRCLLSDQLVLELRDPSGRALAEKTVVTADFLRPGKGRGDAAVEGCIDEYLHGVVRGWTWNRDDPFTPLIVRIFVNDRFAGSYRAADPRPDLAALGMGEGNHGFRVDLNEFFRQFGGARPAVWVETAEPRANVPIAPHARPGRSFFGRSRRLNIREILTPRNFVAEMGNTPRYPKKVFDIASVPGTKMPDPFAADYALLALEFLRREASDLAEGLQNAPDRKKRESELRAVELQLERVTKVALAIAASDKLMRALPAAAPKDE